MKLKILFSRGRPGTCDVPKNPSQAAVERGKRVTW